MASDTDTLKKSLSSLFIITILGLQTMPILTEKTDSHWGDYFWPFTHYPMYNGAHQEGEHVRVGNFVTVTLSNGKETEISYEHSGELGLNFFDFQDLCAKLVKPDGHLHAHEFTALHPLGDEIVKLDIYNYPVIVTRDGPKEAEMELLNSIVINTKTKGEMQ